VRCGMMSARGKLLLMADADGATLFRDLERLMAALLSPRGIAVGSRAHVVSEAVARRSALRNLLMRGFHLIVRWVGIGGVCAIRNVVSSSSLEKQRESFFRVFMSSDGRLMWKCCGSLKGTSFPSQKSRSIGRKLMEASWTRCRHQLKCSRT
jgi:hypothetical protein